VRNSSWTRFHGGQPFRSALRDLGLTLIRCRLTKTDEEWSERLEGCPDGDRPISRLKQTVCLVPRTTSLFGLHA
jgi:hypothetical protein